MNEFYDISEENKELSHPYQLNNLGSQKLFASFGGNRRRSDFWGYDNTPPSRNVYTKVTPEDYDGQLASRLWTFKPIYELEKLLNFHASFYVNKKGGTEDKFIKQIKYVVLPMIQKRKDATICAGLINEWITDRENFMALSTNNLHNKVIDQAGDILPKTVHPIHFEDWSGRDFEWLVFSYLKSQPKFTNVEWLGETGQDGGRDIWTEVDGKSYCFQCANYQKLVSKKATDDIDKLVNADTIPHTFILVCGGPISATLRDTIKSYARMKAVVHAQVWSGREFEETLRNEAPTIIKRFVMGEPFPEQDENGREVAQQIKSVRKTPDTTITDDFKFAFTSGESFHEWFNTILSNYKSFYYAEIRRHWNTYSLRDDSEEFKLLLVSNLQKTIDYGLLSIIADYADTHLNYDLDTVAIYNRPHLSMRNAENEGYNLPVYFHIAFIGILYSTAIRNRVDINLLSHHNKHIRSIFSGMIQKMIANIQMNQFGLSNEYQTGYHWLIGEIFSITNNWLDTFNEDKYFIEKSSYVDYITSNIKYCLSELYNGEKNSRISEHFIIQQIYYGIMNDYFSSALKEPLRTSIENNIIVNIPERLIKPILEFALDEKYAIDLDALLANEYPPDLDRTDIYILDRAKTFLLEKFTLNDLENL